MLQVSVTTFLLEVELEDPDNHRRPLGGSLSRVGCHPHPFGCNSNIVIFIDIIIRITIVIPGGLPSSPFWPIVVRCCNCHHCLHNYCHHHDKSLYHNINHDHLNLHPDHRLVRREYWVALQLPEKIICSDFTKNLLIETFAPDFSFG